jgi:hypothetical protein
MRKSVIAAALVAATGCSAGHDKAVAEAGVAQFHRMLDAGRYHDIYASADDQFRQAGSEQAATRFMALIHDRLGPVRRADPRGWRVNFAPGGNMVGLSYTTQFARGRGTEDFAFRVRGGSASLVGFHVNSMDLFGAPAPPPAPDGGKRNR